MSKPSYVLQSPVVAIRKDIAGEPRSLVTLGTSSTLTVLSDPNDIGLVNVACEAIEYLVFQQDLDGRALLQLAAALRQG